MSYDFRFIYTDEVDITMEYVLAILYAAQKYLIKPLIKLCCDFIEVELNASNASGSETCSTA